jgi:hypothetical protein
MPGSQPGMTPDPEHGDSTIISSNLDRLYLGSNNRSIKDAGVRRFDSEQQSANRQERNTNHRHPFTIPHCKNPPFFVFYPFNGLSNISGSINYHEHNAIDGKNQD